MFFQKVIDAYIVETVPENNNSLEDISDKEIEKIWEEFEDVLFIEAKEFYSNKEYENDTSLVLAQDWKGWSSGTSIETIWGMV